MFTIIVTWIVIIGLFYLNFLLIINTQTISMCDTLNDTEGNDENSLLKLQRVRALCDAISNKEDLDFDLTEIDSDIIY